MSEPPEEMGNHFTGAATLPVLRVVPPTKVDGYLIVARDLLQGVEALAVLPGVSPRAAALLAGHTLECALAAFLFHKGVDVSSKPNIWHDLLALWDMARKESLPLPLQAPDWVAILSSGHGRPFYFRYQKGEGGTIVNGGQTPALVPMVVALRQLVKTVELAVKPT